MSSSSASGDRRENGVRCWSRWTASRTDGSPYMPSATNLREEFEHSDSFDRFTDLVIGEIEGRIVASAGVVYLWLVAPRLLPDRKERSMMSRTWAFNS